MYDHSSLFDKAWLIHTGYFCCDTGRVLVAFAAIAAFVTPGSVVITPNLVHSLALFFTAGGTLLHDFHLESIFPVSKTPYGFTDFSVPVASCQRLAVTTLVAAVRPITFVAVQASYSIPTWLVILTMDTSSYNTCTYQTCRATCAVKPSQKDLFW